MQPPPFFIDTIFLGCLSRETIINRKKEIYIDRPGGNLLYSAYAHKLWGKSAGLLSKVGASFSEDWIDQISRQGFNTDGITHLPNDLDTRAFYFIDPSGAVFADNPQKYFLSLDQPFPKNLLGYSHMRSKLDSKHTCEDSCVKPEDVPPDYFDCRNLALCPLDFVSHSLIPGEFRSRSNTRIFMHASQGYMHSSFFPEFPALVSGSELFFTSANNAKALFTGKTEDEWELLEFLSSFGIETSVLYEEEKGYFIYLLPNRKKFFLPNFPVEIVDPVGGDDAFFGGYIARYLKSFDPVIASVAGAVSAGIKKEGTTPHYLLETLPELAAGRLEKLQAEVQPR